MNKENDMYKWMIILMKDDEVEWLFIDRPYLDKEEIINYLNEHYSESTILDAKVLPFISKE